VEFLLETRFDNFRKLKRYFVNAMGKLDEAPSALPISQGGIINVVSKVGKGTTFSLD
jgi:hypothetical protein